MGAGAAGSSMTWADVASAVEAVVCDVKGVAVGRMDEGSRSAVGGGIDDDEAMDDTERGESARLLARDASRDSGSTGDEAWAGEAVEGVGGR